MSKLHLKVRVPPLQVALEPLLANLALVLLRGDAPLVGLGLGSQHSLRLGEGRGKRDALARQLNKLGLELRRHRRHRSTRVLLQERADRLVLVVFGGEGCGQLQVVGGAPGRAYPRRIRVSPSSTPRKTKMAVPPTPVIPKG